MTNINIATFNVNSVKSRLPILETWLKTPDAPEIICLQELKCRDEEFPLDFFTDLGYNCYFKGMKAYNGVAVISKIKAANVFFGLDDEGEDGRAEQEAARCMFADFGNFSLLNTYIPQGKEIDNPDYHYKLRFFVRVRSLIEKHCKVTDKFIWVGDLNVAPTDIDVTNPKTKKDHVCFHEDVKKALKSVMQWGLVDIFRMHLQDAGHYTFWDYRVKDSLNRNIGWRIDHILGTSSAAEKCVNVKVLRELRAMERPSDHTAIVASFEF